MLLPRFLLLSKFRNVRVAGLFVALVCAFFVVLTTFRQAIVRRSYWTLREPVRRER